MTDTANNTGQGAASSSAAAAAAGAGTAAPPPANASGGAAPSPDWRAGLAPELRDDPTVKRYTDINAMAKGLVEANKALGRTGVRVPQEGDGPEIQAQFRKALGVPDTAEAYEFKPPEGFPAERWDKTFEADFKKLAHEHGIPPKAAQKIVEAYAQRQADGYKQVAAARAATVDNLKKDWGDKFDAMNASADQAIETYARKAGFTDEDFSTLSAAGLGEKMMRLMASFGAEGAPARGPGAHVGEGGMSLEGINKRLGEIASHPKFFDNRFRHDPEVKAMVTEQTRLFEEKTKLTGGGRAA